MAPSSAQRPPKRILGFSFMEQTEEHAMRLRQTARHRQTAGGVRDQMHALQTQDGFAVPMRTTQDSRFPREELVQLKGDLK